MEEDKITMKKFICNLLKIVWRILGLIIINVIFGIYIGINVKNSYMMQLNISSSELFAAMLYGILLAGGGVVLGGIWSWFDFKKNSEGSWKFWFLIMIALFVILASPFWIMEKITYRDFIWEYIYIFEQIGGATAVRYALKNPYSKHKKR